MNTATSWTLALVLSLPGSVSLTACADEESSDRVASQQGALSAGHREDCRHDAPETHGESACHPPRKHDGHCPPPKQAQTDFSALGGGFGSSTSYAPVTPARWSVVDDQGDARYALDMTGVTPSSDTELAELSTFTQHTYADLRMRLRARLNAALTPGTTQGLAIVYGYADANNYAFVHLTTEAATTRLHRRIEGASYVVGGAAKPGITDTSYHDIEVWRHGGWVRVTVDGETLISENDGAAPLEGRIGVGSSSASSYFDDIFVNGYAIAQTDHFDLSFPDEYESRRDVLTSLLENAYALNRDNTGWDVNARFGRERYRYLYRPDGWIWLDDAHGGIGLGGNLPSGIPGAGGLTISGGPSAVLSSLIPESVYPTSTSPNVLVAITLHELGNGWALPNHALPSPWVEWLRSESHSGFLRAEAELDLGYCADANREHANHYSAYVDTPLEARRLSGSNVEPLLVSMREHYGWPLFRALYDAAQAHQLDFLSGLGDEERDNEMLLFLSRAAGEDLSGVLERELGITVHDDVRAALSQLPPSNLAVLTTLPCHPAAIHATPGDVALSTQDDTRERKLYVQAPEDWTYRVEPQAPWLSVQREGAGPTTTLTLRIVDSQIAACTTRDAVVVLESASGLSLQVPVRATAP